MKRKILSFAIAFALLSQTIVSAGALSTLVSGLLSRPLPVEPHENVTTTVTGYVKSVDDGSFKMKTVSGYDSTADDDFDYKAEIDMKSVRDAFDTYYTFGKDAAVANSLGTDFDNSTVTGAFDVTFTYDSGITQDTAATKPYATLQLPGSSIFTITSYSTPSAGTIVYHTKVKDATPLTVGTLKATAATALADFSLEVDKLKAVTRQSNIKVKMTGYVDITETDNTTYAKINFDSNTADVTVYDVGTGHLNPDKDIDGGNNGGNGGNEETIIDENTKSNNPSITATKNPNTNTTDVTNNGTTSRRVTVKSNIDPKPGFVENGLSFTPYGGGDPGDDGTISFDLEPGQTVRLYPRYVNVTVPSALEPETDENGNFLHKVYIQGYPDGEVKPNGNITREEVTAAFDRLLNTVYRATIETTEQNFPDVNDDRWSNDSIATMANGGYIVGDENGNFNPAEPITRAQFAVIAAKFAPVDAEPGENYFTDIEDHWAKDFILKIAGQYWISGNPDGTFNPDAPITRAEAMTIINRMLVRYGDEDSDYAKQWPDVDKSAWYYDSVIEATTHNTYVRTENGWSEKWVSELSEAVTEEEIPADADTEEAETEAEADTETETPAEE